MTELDVSRRRYASMAAALLLALGVAACDEDSSDASGDAGGTETEETASESDGG